MAEMNRREVMASMFAIGAFPSMALKPLAKELEDHLVPLDDAEIGKRFLDVGMKHPPMTGETYILFADGCDFWVKDFGTGPMYDGEGNRDWHNEHTAHILLIRNPKYNPMHCLDWREYAEGLTSYISEAPQMIRVAHTIKQLKEGYRWHKC